MNAYEAAAELAQIGAEARTLIHGPAYDIVVNYTDGTSDCSNDGRVFDNARERDERMTRVCEWLHRTGRDRDIESIELVGLRDGQEWRHLYFPRRPGLTSVAIGRRPERVWR